MGIEKKFEKLDPSGQNAVVAFIEFLLSRQNEREGLAGEHEYEDEDTLPAPAYDTMTQRNGMDQPLVKADTSGIILAEERPVGDTDDIIDFADINARFSQTKNETETPPPVRKQKKLDWL